MAFDVAVLLFFCVVHGLFTLAEISLGSSRRARLAVDAENGSGTALKALELVDNPSSYIPTIQLGTSLVGVLNGVYAGAELQVPLRDFFERLDFSAHASEIISLLIVVAVITVSAVLIGELIPRRIAHNKAETVAKLCAPVLLVILKVVGPPVRVLDGSSRAFLRLLGLRETSQSPRVTEEEVKILIEQGAQSGVFDEAEEQILSQALRLADRTAGSMMSNRQDIEWIDINDPIDTIWSEVSSSSHSYFPVGDGSVEKIIGIIALKDLARALLSQQRVDVRELMKAPLLIPRSASALTVLERFREEKKHIALVVDEWGGVDGLLTANDLAETLFGDMSFDEQTSEPGLVERQDGSFLVDAAMEIDEILEQLKIERQEDNRRRGYHSLGGFVMEQLGHIPTVGERFLFADYWFEVVDMDRLRIDKILISPAVQEMKLTEPH